MELLKRAILERGSVVNKDILKVDSFLNHQIDVGLYNSIGKEFKKRFENAHVTKILTIEASGIGIACIAAQYFSVPVLFAKKTESLNTDSDCYESKVYSFTRKRDYKIRVSKKFLNKEDKILIVDDFLANGKAAMGLADIVEQAGAEIAGIGIVIEKGFQEGGKILRQRGFRVESLAIIDSMDKGQIKFRE